MNRKRHFIHNIIGNYFGFATQLVVVLILTPFMIRMLGDGGFGLWVVVQTVVGYFQVLEMGMLPAVIHHTASGNHREEMESMVASALLWVVLGLVVSVPVVELFVREGGGWFSLQSEHIEVIEDLYWPILFLIVLTGLKRLSHAVIEGRQRMVVLNLNATIATLTGAGCTVSLLLSGWGLEAVLWAAAVQMALELFLNALFIRYRLFLKISPLKASWSCFTEMIRYAIPAFLADVAVMLSHRIDVLVIGLNLPVTQVTVYTIGSRISGMMEKCLDPLVNLLFPLASELHGEGDHDRLGVLLVEGTRLVLILAVPGLLLVGWHVKELVTWWVGADYAEPVSSVVWVLLGVVFMALFEAVAGRILLGTGEVVFDAWVSAVAAVCNVILSVILVRSLGVVGVALGTLLPLLIANGVVVPPYVCRLTGVGVIAFYGRVLGPVVVLVTVTILCLSLMSMVEVSPVVGVLLNSLVVVGITLTSVLWMSRQFIERVLSYPHNGSSG
ncbi:MAG: oligosaccharide flippase family protein [Magnetococcales bacterium]|nr:oligosaccharide flippase family protein [Magnetococcales bacterium]